MKGNKQINFRGRKMKIITFSSIIFFALIWTIFLDSHRLVDWVGYKLKTAEIQRQKAYYLQKIEQDSIRLNELNTNDKNLEKYAREKYRMKKPDEEIYIVEEAKK